MSWANLCVNANDAELTFDPITKSRYNLASAAVVIHFILELIARKVYNEDTVIITPYNAQKAVYLTALSRISANANIPLIYLPRVATSDSMQGQEAEMVFLDPTGTKADTKAEMGIMGDARTMEVSNARAKRACIMVTTLKLVEGMLGNPDGKMRTLDPDRNKQPYTVGHIIVFNNCP